MGLVVDTGSSITAYYRQSENSIHVSTALVELMGASDAGLAFIIAHMATHGVFLSVGAPTPGSGLPIPEKYADVIAALSLVKGGFDGGGAGDFFARLQLAVAVLANIDPAFRTEFELPAGIIDRLHALANNLDSACDVSSSSAALHATCEKARYFWFPDLYAIPRSD